MTKKEEIRILLDALKAQSEFASVPVLWQPGKRGPRMRVTGAEGGTMVIALNYKGLGPEGLVALVKRALVAANEMYRGLTSASAVGSDLEGLPVHEGRGYVMTEREMVAAWRDGMGERIEEIFA